MSFLKKNSRIITFVLLIVISSVSTFSLFKQGFPLTDDGNWMVIRFSAFYETLKSGQFPVRFLTRLNNGYGYPVADFLYPLFMYVGAPIKILGFSFVNVIKIILGSSLILSSVFCFLWFRKYFKNPAALIGAVCYALFPYHLFDVYVRGSVGEVLALSIIPFIFWQIERKSITLTALGIALLITAHNSLAFIFLPVIIMYMFLVYRDRFDSFKKCLISIGLGLGLSAFFWIPALYDRQYTVFNNTAVSDFSKYFVSLSNFNYFGIISVVVLIISMLLFFIKRERRFVFFLLLSIIFTLLTLSFSKIFWDFFPFTNFIQFPFRLISVVSLGIAFLAGYQISLLKQKSLIALFLIYLSLIFVSAKPFLSPKSYENYPDTFYSTNMDTTTVKNEYMPKWVKKSAPYDSNRMEIVDGSGKVENFSSSGSSISFNFNATKSAKIRINTVYFPGWIVKVDGSNVPINYEKSGLIQFSVDPGVHSVVFYFTETPIRFVSDIISLLFLLFLASFIIFKSKLKLLKNS